MLADELATLLNRYSQENGSNTPDVILADYLLACLATWNTQVVRRDEWYGARHDRAVGRRDRLCFRWHHRRYHPLLTLNALSD